MTKSWQMLGCLAVLGATLALATPGRAEESKESAGGPAGAMRAQIQQDKATLKADHEKLQQDHTKLKGDIAKIREERKEKREEHKKKHEEKMKERQEKHEDHGTAPTSGK